MTKVVEGQLEWNQINWNQARKIVKNLRQRIFAARTKVENQGKGLEVRLVRNDGKLSPTVQRGGERSDSC